MLFFVSYHMGWHPMGLLGIQYGRNYGIRKHVIGRVRR